MRAILEKFFGGYLYVAEAGAILLMLWWAYSTVEGRGYERAMREVIAKQVEADKLKAKEIESARHEKDAEMADLSRLVADLMARPRDVRVLHDAPAQQPPSGAGSASSTPVVHTLPDGGAGCENGSRAGAGPDVFPMLRSLAVAADAVSAADREQVRVR